MIRAHDDRDYDGNTMYTQDSYFDQTLSRPSFRPTEFFSKHYDNDEEIFNPNFNTPNQNRFSQFKSPMTRSKRSLSPFENRLGSIVEEDESAERETYLGNLRGRPSNAPEPKRSASQVRFSDRPSATVNRTSRLDRSNSPHSMSRHNDNFFGYNRFTNQPSQLGSSKSGANKFLEDEILRNNKYNRVRQTDK